MQRAISIVLALAAVVLVTVLTVKSAPRLPEPAVLASDAGASDDAGNAAAKADAGAEARAVALGEPAAVDALGGLGSIGDVPPAVVAPTPISGGPRQVRFGVILVEYDGAQGVSAKVRSKRDAMALATKLAADAQTDFKGALKNGDTGSSADVGTVQRGVLEAAPEAAVFALKTGEVSGVIDTPRGFWIVKRIE